MTNQDYINKASNWACVLLIIIACSVFLWKIYYNKANTSDLADENYEPDEFVSMNEYKACNLPGVNENTNNKQAERKTHDLKECTENVQSKANNFATTEKWCQTTLSDHVNDRSDRSKESVHYSCVDDIGSNDSQETIFYDFQIIVTNKDDRVNEFIGLTCSDEYDKMFDSKFCIYRPKAMRNKNG